MLPLFLAIIHSIVGITFSEEVIKLFGSTKNMIYVIITAIVLIINKSDILNATSFLDTTNVSVIMLEVEFAIVVMTFISVEFVLKKYFYKKND